MDKINPTYVTFALYLLFMVGVGAYFYRKNKSLDDYLLGGRGVGSWVTALSAQASDMSGWLLMGLPGAIYMAGMGETWVAIGLALGTLLNWIFIAPRLRIYTEKTNAMTLSSFFANRFRDPSRMLRMVSAAVILIFFTIYAASGLVATGKLFNSMFGFDFTVSVIIGTIIILAYVILGGYLAVCWTDLFQGALMFFALVLVPVLAYMTPEAKNLSEVCQERNLTLSLFPNGFGTLAIMAILSSAVWGLGYCGQPHILTRFMSIKSVKLLPRTTVIAMIWVIISLLAAVVIGVLAIPMYPSLDAGEAEKVFIFMVRDLFNPWIGGILLAAILAAIMSTIDSQLLVSSSTLTEDFYRILVRKDATPKELVLVSRLFVLLMTAIAGLLAVLPNNTIFGIVKFAWGGFGAAFGPVVIMALYSKKTSWQSALGGMVAGTVVMVTWYCLGLNKYMYEILPGFIAGLVVIMIMNKLKPQQDEAILAEYDEMQKELKGGE